MKTTIKAVETAEGVVELISGDKAFAKFSDPEFLAGWDSLYLSCPWATTFQSREYITTWFNVYKQRFQPILLIAVENGELAGLLPLTVNNDLLVGAGHFDAEYQTWLALPGNQKSFIKSALTVLGKSFPKLNIELKYVPRETPIDWIKADQHWKHKCIIGKRSRPVVVTDSESISKKLRKSNMRWKINCLKRSGDMVFERIRDRDTFCSIFDEIATQYDFRQAAKFNKNRLLQISSRKQFLLALFDQELLHVTILKSGNKIIASNVAVMDKNCLYLKGMNTYDPAYAKFSPGILHFLMLGQQLSFEKINVFDLTPGDDPYKDHLANRFDQVYELMIANSRWYYFKRIIRKHIYAYLVRKNLKPLLLKELLKKKGYLLAHKIKTLKKVSLKTLTLYKQLKEPKKIDNFLIYDNKMGLYHNTETLPVNKDNLNDLLMFKAEGTQLTRWEFLEDSMRRFEVGQHAYTFAKDGVLIGCVWLYKIKPKDLTKKNYLTSLPDDALLLHELYWDQNDHDKLITFITSIVNNISSSQSNSEIFVDTHDLNKNLLRKFKAAGFAEFTRLEEAL